MNKIVVVFILTFIVFISCEKETENPMTPEVILSKINVVNMGFEDSEGNSFFPWGFNYTNADNVGLIEDDWLNESTWAIIQEDFSEMKALGANIVRIHLQYNKFMTDANTPNETALNRLKEFVEFSEKMGIYLDITGLCAYRKIDQPEYYDDLSDAERWETQTVFWKSVANKVGESPAVFAFNLMNEPVVSVGCDGSSTCDWLIGDGLGGFHFVQNITLNPGLNYVTTMKEWMAKMTAAIRSEDDKTPITVGFLDLGGYSQFNDDLDYLSPHIYPKSTELDVSVDRLNNNQTTVPIVIEEISNLHCNIDELGQFFNEVEGKYQGMMGHYFGKTIGELDLNTISGALRNNFLQYFVDNNPN